MTTEENTPLPTGFDEDEEPTEWGASSRGAHLHDQTLHVCKRCGHQGPIATDFGWVFPNDPAKRRRQSWCNRCRAEASRISENKRRLAAKQSAHERELVAKRKREAEA